MTPEGLSAVEAENSAILMEMARDGDNLSNPRQVDFVSVFPSKESAEAFGNELRKTGAEPRISYTGTVPELPWDVTISRVLALTVELVSATEIEVSDVAAKFGGRSDGWGCFAS